MDLLNMVVQPTWREFLTDLVHREELDPWSVDLMQVADVYLRRVREMQAVDLRLPANVILASALLLRFKADLLSFEDPQAVLDSAMDYDAPSFLSEGASAPQLVAKPNQPRARRVTLGELMNAIESVMRQGKRVLPLPGEVPALIELELPKEGMNERMHRVYEKAVGLKDHENVLLFSSLANEGEHPVKNLLPVLHLVQEHKMLAWQDELFGDIFLKVLDGSAITPPNTA